MAYIVMTMTYIVMAYIVMVYIVMTMAYIVMAYIVMTMAYTVMAYVVMAYVAMSPEPRCHSCARTDLHIAVCGTRMSVRLRVWVWVRTCIQHNVYTQRGPT